MKIKNYKEISQTKERKIVLDILEKGIDSVLPENILTKYVKVKNNILEIKDKKFELKDYENIFVTGFGKASYQMAETLNEILKDKINYGYVNSTVNKKVGNIKINKAGHPIPDEKGMKGAQEISSIKCEKNDLVIVLISGGGSAMLALPEDTISLKDLEQANEILLKSGADINEINAIRKHISQVKGGKLAEKFHPATIISLIISDVIGDDLSVIASGPTAPDKTKFKNALDVIEKYELTNSLPPNVIEYLKIGTKETIKEDNVIFEKVHNFILANNFTALEVMKEEAKKQGFKVEIKASSLEGEARQVGRYIADELINAEEKTILLFGGETTVTVKGTGLGGRNQELILSAIEKIKDEDITVAAIGTDGIDFHEVAGAIADENSYKRAQELKLDIQSYLDNNDAYNFFKKMKDYIMTGYTGTNVCDIIVGVKKWR